jgi:transcriptional regulator with XRE-family HTH domain
MDRSPRGDGRVRRSGEAQHWPDEKGPVNVGKRMRMIRRSRRLEISSVAKISRVDERRVSAIERGSGDPPKRSELHAIAMALSVGVAALTGEAPPEFA